MAQRILDKYSAETCISYAERHLRLNAQCKGTEPLTIAMQPAIADASTKAAMLKGAEKTKFERYDQTLFLDAELDNAIRDTAAKCTSFDRENPTARVYASIFPQNTSPIINTYHLNEADEVRKVIIRLQALGAEHPLFAEAAALQTIVDKVDNAAQAYYDAITDHARCKAEQEIAKIKLIKQYTANIFNAELMFGRKFSDRLFPQIMSSSSSTPQDAIVVETQNQSTQQVK